MINRFTCIVCPNGCDITVETEAGKIIKIEGNTCKRGEEYVVNELTAPMRTIATSVKVENGNLPLVSVRLSKPIPKEKIFEAVEALKKLTLQAPVSIGDVVIENICGCDSSAIVTKNINKI